MSRWFRYGIQGVAAGLAALLLTGAFHLLTPVCTMPIRDVTPPVACAAMPDVQTHPSAPTCTTSEPAPCCTEEQPLLSTRQPVPSCSHALGAAKSRLPLSTPRPLRAPAAPSIFTASPPVPLHVQLAVLLI